MPKSRVARMRLCTLSSLVLAAAAFGAASAAPPPLAVRTAVSPLATETIILNFNLHDGNLPNAGLTEDAHGNLYGTTSYNGGVYGYGNVFELKHTKQGWKEIVLHDFNGSDGAYPLGIMVLDAKGNLYGTAQVGGSGACTNGSPPLGCGVAFELSPGKGGWKEQILYSFVPGNTKGTVPVGGLVFDKAGNLYGTTWAPGVESLDALRHNPQQNTFWGCSEPGCGGTVFELSPTASGAWKETDLYAFTGGADGSSSVASLVFDAAGNLYGTTNYGGGPGCVYDCGVVFELSPHGSQWTETVLHDFTGGSDGGYPMASLVWDAAGNLYSTASTGGAGGGTVFELSPAGSTWNENVLYAFKGTTDGGTPTATVTFDNSGNIFGTASADGNQYNSGVVYELKKLQTGYKQKVLHIFLHAPSDGQGPNTPLIFGPGGMLYGTTQGGGKVSHGTVYSITP
jgi:uncharacterized repeat protein (TIGR03803 family)